MKTRTTTLLEQELAEFARKNQELRQENERLKGWDSRIDNNTPTWAREGYVRAEERGARSAFELIGRDVGGITATPEWLEVKMTEWRRRRKDGK